nr:probable protein phosphatase 2C 55 [Quercus suber]
MIAGAFYIAKTKVNSTAEGDDAYFICREKQTIGVADGVGGWAKLGVDPGEYARQLMINSLKAILMEPEGKINLKRVLNQAFLDSNAIGSSTACIINLKDHCLHVANVGDSGFMLIRKRGGIYKSEIQQRSFNHPFQLGKLNADVLDSVQADQTVLELQEGQEGSGRPRDAPRLPRATWGEKSQSLGVHESQDRSKYSQAVSN